MYILKMLLATKLQFLDVYWYLYSYYKQQFLEDNLKDV